MIISGDQGIYMDGVTSLYDKKTKKSDPKQA